jgi:chromosome partitioning protein
MGMRIAVVNSKGGVSKTTTAVHLAAAAARLGGNTSVELFDLDRQSSAHAWLNAAPKPSNVRVVKATIGSLSNTRADVTIIDTAPGSEREIEQAAAVADYVVIPTQPGPLNDARALATWRYINHKNSPAAVLLTNVDTRRREALNTRKLLEAQAAVFETIIPARAMIARAHGSWPKDLHGYEQVLTELMEDLDG